MKRLVCLVYGHDWGNWAMLLVSPLRVRTCDRCRKREWRS